MRFRTEIIADAEWNGRCFLLLRTSRVRGTGRRKRNVGNADENNDNGVFFSPLFRDAECLSVPALAPCPDRSTSGWFMQIWSSSSRCVCSCVCVGSSSKNLTAYLFIIQFNLWIPYVSLIVPGSENTHTRPGHRRVSESTDKPIMDDMWLVRFVQWTPV